MGERQPLLDCRGWQEISQTSAPPIRSIVANIDVYEIRRDVQPQTAFAVALLIANRVRRRVPLAGIALSERHIRRLIITVMRRIDMKTVGRSTDLLVVRPRTIPRMDLARPELPPQRFQVLSAQILESSKLTTLDPSAIVTVKLLDDEMSAQPMSGFRHYSPFERH